MSAADRELFHKWVAKAEDDLQAASTLQQQKPILAAVVCFLCQQAAEKYVKGLLALHGKSIPRIHDLRILIEAAAKLGIPLGDIRTAARTLTDYAVDARYPDAPMEFTAALAQEAEQHALAIKSAVLNAARAPLQGEM